MRKKEMSKEQLATRKQIIDRLKKAGWEEGAAMQGFDEGDFLPEEAVLEHHGKMDMTVSYSAGEGHVDFLMEKGLGGAGLTVRMKCLDQLPAVLDYIATNQNKITDKNFRDHVVELVEICPDAYADRGKEGWVKLDNKAPRQKKEK